MAGGSYAERQTVLADLRDRLARIEAGPARKGSTLSLGPGLDGWLPKGGLVCGAVHEVMPQERALPAAAMGFSILALARLDAAAGPILWLARAGRGRLYARGLAGLGFDPGRLILVTPSSAQDLLWAAEEALRCRGIGAVVMEVASLGLTPARRLALAAEAGGTLGLLLRETAGASSCCSRWCIGTAPGDKAGDWAPRLVVALDRCAGGPPKAPAEMQWQGPAEGFVALPRPVESLDRLARVI